MLPNFLIIGAQKGATSWLARCLDQHPDAFVPEWEVHFFNHRFSKGLEWYESQFPRREKQHNPLDEFEGMSDRVKYTLEQYKILVKDKIESGELNKIIRLTTFCCNYDLIRGKYRGRDKGHARSKIYAWWFTHSKKEHPDFASWLFAQHPELLSLPALSLPYHLCLQ